MDRSTRIKDRAAGAVIGALIGDALALGPHWYYDLEEMRRDYGTWITDYTDPKPNRYHGGLKAGQPSQAGIITTMLLRSVVENQGYNEDDFCKRLDQDLFPLLDGTPMNGPGGYTSQSIRGAWKARVKQKLSWKQTGGQADTTEAAERTLILAARYSRSLSKVAESVSSNCLLTQADEAIVAMTTAYCCVLALLVQGHPFDADISSKLMELVKSGELPFLAVTSGNLQPPKSGNLSPPRAVYGMPCAIYHQLPAAYYLASRFSGDFEQGVLQALNGGGQNQARSILTGALIGAQVGLVGIPKRFLDGLENAKELVGLAEELADQAERSD